MTDLKIARCPEFPFFGATYPDATCIDGFLWDLDKCNEDGSLYGGGEIPCPCCNTEAYIDYFDGDDVFRQEVSAWVRKIKEKYSKP